MHSSTQKLLLNAILPICLLVFFGGMGIWFGVLNKEIDDVKQKQCVHANTYIGEITNTTSIYTYFWPWVYGSCNYNYNTATNEMPICENIEQSVEISFYYSDLCKRNYNHNTVCHIYKITTFYIREYFNVDGATFNFRTSDLTCRDNIMGCKDMIDSYVKNYKSYSVSFYPNKKVDYTYDGKCRFEGTGLYTGIMALCIVMVVVCANIFILFGYDAIQHYIMMKKTWDVIKDSDGYEHAKLVTNNYGAVDNPDENYQYDDNLTSNT